MSLATLLGCSARGLCLAPHYCGARLFVVLKQPHYNRPSPVCQPVFACQLRAGRPAVKADWGAPRHEQASRPEF